MAPDFKDCHSSTKAFQSACPLNGATMFVQQALCTICKVLVLVTSGILHVRYECSVPQADWRLKSIAREC